MEIKEKIVGHRGDKSLVQDNSETALSGDDHLLAGLDLAVNGDFGIAPNPLPFGIVVGTNPFPETRQGDGAVGMDGNFEVEPDKLGMIAVPFHPEGRIGIVLSSREFSLVVVAHFEAQFTDSAGDHRFRFHNDHLVGDPLIGRAESAEGLA